MKILKITQQDNEIEVEVEGYPHAKPVFPVDISEADLKTQLATWKTNQDEVDAINDNPPAPTTPTDISALKALEGKEI